MADNSSLMKESDDVVLNFGEEDELDRQKRLKHPLAVFFHILFRAAALLSYVMCEFFSSSFITNFIILVLLLCMDFWTVKNISGRLLVGLRWWNYVDEEGQSHWVYESRKGTPGSKKISAVESRIFWFSMVVCQILWVVFCFVSLFGLNFKWLMVAVVGFLMTGANFYGYVRCKMGSKKDMTSVAKNFLTAQFIKSMFTAASTPKATDSRTAPSQP
ncbi:hypothetical protein ACOMHN_005291 [Nucella lapillus]